MFLLETFRFARTESFPGLVGLLSVRSPPCVPSTWRVLMASQPTPPGPRILPRNNGLTRPY